MRVPLFGSRASDYDKIRFGVSNIKGGNLGYKINGIKSEDNRLLAQEINEIGEGLSRSVSEKLKARANENRAYNKCFS